MARYEFGIMENTPAPGCRYDEYNPEAYPRLVTVIDDDFDPYLTEFRGEVYWHTLDVRGEGIAMAGINLIPPASSAGIAEMIRGNAELYELEQLLLEAVNEDKFVILFGL